MPVVVIFGNSQCSESSFEYQTAELIGKNLGERGFDVATGGYGGVMEAALKGASGYKVQKIGITFEDETRIANSYLTQELEVESYFERLLKLLEIGDAFIILPGGTGTLMEFSAIWALKERSLLIKPIIYIGEQWNEVIQTIGFYSEKTLDSTSLLFAAENVDEVVKEIDRCFPKT